jgi:hypothetical protein
MATFGIFVFEKKFRAISIPNPLHVLEQNLLTAAVIESRAPAVGMAGDPLSGFKGAVKQRGSIRLVPRSSRNA